MDSLLTLPLGDYRSGELMLRLVVALIAMTALLLGLSSSFVQGGIKIEIEIKDFFISFAA